MIRKIATIILKAIVVLISVIITAITLTGISPVYSFSAPEPFSGDRIYNPYSDYDPAIGWKRCVLHTHTKVDKGINECPYYPATVLSDYRELGYEIVGFSNHNALTTHPEDPLLQINEYEHGYNILKYHKLVIGAQEVLPFDQLLPVLTSQKQFMIDMLAKKGCDIIAFNHPDRTLGMLPGTLTKVTGYRLIEGQSNDNTTLHYWDEALSSGIYVHNLINDDNHNSKDSWSMARRSSFLNTPTPYYKDIKKCLIDGNFYTMSTPDFGEGDHKTKVRENKRVPKVIGIGADNDTLHIKFDRAADSIVAITQQGRRVARSTCSNTLYHIMAPDEPYIRFTAYFPEQTVIYSNAFARCSDGNNPYTEKEHPVNIPLTILYNLMLLAIAVLVIYLNIRIFK